LVNETQVKTSRSWRGLEARVRRFMATVQDKGRIKVGEKTLWRQGKGCRMAVRSIHDVTD
jgi:hypothetical protein